MITSTEAKAIEKLKGCTFLPGSAVKRFVRSLPVCTDLTPRQKRFLRDTFFSYRGQMELTDECANEWVEKMIEEGRDGTDSRRMHGSKV